MNYDFFAYVNRMKHIKRWALMRSKFDENVMEHTAQVSVIAHALAEIKNLYFGGKVDVLKVVLFSQYHETSEVITGDLPTPIKYFNKEINHAYKDIEKGACLKLLNTLPKESLKYPYNNFLLLLNTLVVYRLIQCMHELKIYMLLLHKMLFYYIYLHSEYHLEI